MLAEPGGWPDSDSGAGAWASAALVVWPRDIKPALAPATTDDKLPGNHKRRDVRLK
jgi:hypothetical protein